MKIKAEQVIWLSAIIGCLIGLYLILGLDTFAWDESHHAYFSNQMYNDVRSFNFNAFWFHTGNQAWFQPLHSWVNAIFLLVLGHSIFAARSTSLFLFALLFYVIYKLSIALLKEKGAHVASVASVMLATSPLMLVLSSINMQEMLGAVVITLSLLYYISKCEKPSLVSLMLMGFIISIVALVKYPYGLLLGAGIFINETGRIFEVKDKLEWVKSWVFNNLLIMAGFLPLMILWFTTPPVQRKVGLLFMRLNDVQGWSRGLDLPHRILFYGGSILVEYAFCSIVGLLLISGLIYSFKYIKDFKVRALLSTVTAFLLFHIAINDIFERLIAPMIPLLFILTGIMLVDLKNWLKRTKNKAVSSLCVLLVILSLSNIGSLIPYTKELANYTGGILAYKQKFVTPCSPLVLGTVKMPAFITPAPPNKEIHINFSAAPVSRLNDILDYCSKTIPANENAGTMMCLLQMSPYHFYWSFNNRVIMTKNDYTAQPQNFWFMKYYIEFDISENSPYVKEVVDDSLNVWKEASKPYKQRGWLTLYASKDFADLGIKVNIYKMKLPF